MKKKIIVFANGWGESIIESYVRGMFEGLSSDCADLFLFLCYAYPLDSNNVLRGELNIYNLPKLSDFDGAIIIGNGMDVEGMFESICDRCRDAGIPYITTGRRDGDTFFVGMDNNPGMHALVRHLIKDHEYKDFFFFAGAHASPDSKARLAILKDELSDNGLSISDERIYETSWSPEVAVSKVEEMIKEGAMLPNVFVCANDILAMAVAARLTELGVKVPEDVAVTGFDNISFAGIFTPSIASVNPDFESIGRASSEALLKILSGEKLEGEVLVSGKFIPSESCGCPCNPEEEKARMNLGREAFLGQMGDSLFDRKLTSIERNLVFTDNYEELKSTLSKILLENHDYEGQGFHIVLDTGFMASKENPEFELAETGYADELDALISYDNGRMDISKKVTRNELVPSYSGAGANRFYMFLPLHEDKYTLGYVVFCDDIQKIATSSKLFTYVGRLDLVLGKIKQNINVKHLVDTLKRLNTTDTLTSVKNRNAYENKEEELDELISAGVCPDFSVAVFDVNNLKTVNDSLGHAGGDEYLINCCRLICNSFKKSPVYRIGGDEFLTIVTANSDESMSESVESMQNTMKELEGANVGLAEKLSIAVGYTQYERGKDTSFDDVFSRADNLMYENKARMKGKANIR